MAYLSARGLAKSYRESAVPVAVFESLDLDVAVGEMLAIVGPSGVGKSTLLHLLGGLDRPDSGEILVGGEDLTKMSNDGLARYRNSSVGFGFQFHHLLPDFNAMENVAMPAWIGGARRKEALESAAGLLDELGLSERARHFPNQLSGGEQQRVAMARALLSEPKILLADEPTGNLDYDTSERVFDLMRDCHQKRGLTSVVVTHNHELASRCDRIYAMGHRQGQ